MRHKVKAHSSHQTFLNLIWVTDQENSLISSINHLSRVCPVLISMSVKAGEEATIAEETGLRRERECSSCIDLWGT